MYVTLASHIGERAASLELGIDEKDVIRGKFKRPCHIKYKPF